MQAHLLRIWKEVDVTILFITHDLDEAVYLSDRIVVLGARPGRIVEVIDNPVPRPAGRNNSFPATFSPPSDGSKSSFIIAKRDRNRTRKSLLLQPDCG